MQGATIPRCANGVKLSYILPPIVNSEDAAITGAGSWASRGENHFPWLYEYEEQEGEIDFMTRIVAITFYPASATPGNMAMTLGQVVVQTVHVSQMIKMLF